MRNYLRSLDPHLPRDVYVLQLGGLLNAFGNGIVLPFLIIYLHNVRGISLGVAGLAAATQSATGLASGFLGGSLSDRIGAKRVLFATLNFLLTVITMRLGPAFYGYGFALATALTSVTGLSLISRRLDTLEEDTFMQQA